MPIYHFFVCYQTYEESKHENPPLSVGGVGGLGHLGGARIGIVAKPSAEFVAGILGTWLSGGVAVPLALSYPEAELLHVMNDSVHPGIPFFFKSSIVILLSCHLIFRSAPTSPYLTLMFEVLKSNQ